MARSENMTRFDSQMESLQDQLRETSRVTNEPLLQHAKGGRMILDFARADARAVVASAARVAGLEPPLVAAIVLQESGGNPWAWNPEPRYRWFWDVRAGRAFRQITAAEIASEVPPADFHSLAGDADQEWWAQQASWGLMQVMGANAREHGCREPFLTALLDPALGLRYGCLYLASLFAHNPGAGREGAVSAYNAGHPTPDNEDTYVRPVIARLALLEGYDWAFC